MYVFSNVRGDPLLPRFPLPGLSSGSVARVRVLARALFAGSASICWKRKTTHYLPRGRVLWFGRLIFFPSATSLCTRNWISLALSMPRKFIAVERWEALSMVRCSPGESMVVSFIFRLLYFFHKLGKKDLFLFLVTKFYIEYKQGLLYYVQATAENKILERASFARGKFDIRSKW